MNCLARVVRDSSQLGGSIPQLVTTPDGEMHVKFFDWSQFLLNHFKVLPGITSYHISTLIISSLELFLFANIRSLPSTAFRS